jgi:transcriptional regulator with XRE-family HTH domain
MARKTDTIGARIRYWRMRRNGISQAVLAGLADVSQSYISQVESGRKTIGRRSPLVAIAAALQVTVADLLGQGSEPGDPARERAATRGAGGLGASVDWHPVDQVVSAAR